MNRITGAGEYLRIRLLIAIMLTLVLSCSALAANDKTAVKVMTRNMDSGTDLLFVFAAIDVPSFISAMAATYAEINASNIPLRAGRLADEIASTQPDLIGLQEATLWRTGPLDNSPAT